MKPNNTFTIRIGNQDPATQTSSETTETTQQNNTFANVERVDQPQVSLLEQVRARNIQVGKTVFSNQSADEDESANSKTAAYDQSTYDQSGTWKQDQAHHTQRSVSSNYTYSWSTDTNHGSKLQVKHLMTKKGKTSGLAAVLGILVGVLLGIGAYFLFTGVAKPASGTAVGMSGNGKSQAGATGSGALNMNGNAQKQTGTSTVATNNTGAGTPLGPGGATTGTTVYLYQIGIFSDASALNKQVQTLKDNGFLSFQRGSQPTQLVAGAAPNKSGIDGMNTRLQEAAVEYYMKPFIVPDVPDQIGSLSDSSSNAIRKALQDEWNIADSFNQQEQTDSLSAVAQRVKDALQALPANDKQAIQDIDASLNDLQQIHDLEASSSSNTDQVIQQSYWLGKFYTEYAQGVVDLQS